MQVTFLGLWQFVPGESSVVPIVLLWAICRRDPRGECPRGK
jgi:hypothetical protein